MESNKLPTKVTMKHSLTLCSYIDAFLSLLYFPPELRSKAEKKAEIESLKVEMGDQKELIDRQQQELQAKPAQVGQPGRCWVDRGKESLLLFGSDCVQKFADREEALTRAEERGGGISGGGCWRWSCQERGGEDPWIRWRTVGVTGEDAEDRTRWKRIIRCGDP